MIVTCSNAPGMKAPAAPCSCVSIVVIRRRLFGLLRERLVLPQSALRSGGGNGGFIVEWPLQELAQQPGQEAAASAPTPAAAPLRLDPARGDEALLE